MNAAGNREQSNVTDITISSLSSTFFQANQKDVYTILVRKTLATQIRRFVDLPAA